MFILEVWIGNFGQSFDAGFLKPHVLLDLFIMNMKCNLCKEIIYRKRIINNFWAKTKLRQLDFFLKFQPIFLFKFFQIFLIKILNITSADHNRNMHIVYKKKFQI